MEVRNVKVGISRESGSLEEIDASLMGKYVQFDEPIALLNGDILVLPVADILSVMMDHEEVGANGDYVSHPPEPSIVLPTKDPMTMPTYKQYGVAHGESEPAKALAIVMVVSFGFLLVIALFIYLMS